MVQRICQQIAGAPRFQGLILVVIMFASFLVGLETFPDLHTAHRELFDLLDGLLLAIL